MRNISFALTTEQIRRRLKTVTRRVGWLTLRPGTVLCAVEKCQGLKKGAAVQRIGTIKVETVRREPLRTLLDDRMYGLSEVEREGFAGHPTLGTPEGFINFFIVTHQLRSLDEEVTRIEFSYLEDGVCQVLASTTADRRSRKSTTSATATRS